MSSFESCPLCHVRTLASWKVQLSSHAFPVKCANCGGEFCTLRGITSWYVVGPLLLPILAFAFFTLPLIEAAVGSAVVLVLAAWTRSGRPQLLQVSPLTKNLSRAIFIGTAFALGLMLLAAELR